MNQQKKLKGALIGFGFISAKGHYPAYLKRDDVEILAICDISPERRRDVPEHIRFYTDYLELLTNEAAELDFVDIATHAADHYKIAKAALEIGLNVLCEKPLVTSINQAKDLLITAVANEKVLFPCHNYKHAPVISTIRELLRSEKIGKVKSITLSTFRNTHAVGTREWKPDWRRFKQYSGGGIAMDHGSHSLYLMFEWLRGYPTSVTATALNLSTEFDTEDNFSAVYEFEEGLAHVHLTWTAGARKVIYTLQGEKGAITVDDDQIQIAILKNLDDENISHKAEWSHEKLDISSNWMDSSHVGWFNSMFDQFKTAMEKNDILNKEIIDSYFCIQAIMKSYESVEKNSQQIRMENIFPNIL